MKYISFLLLWLALLINIVQESLKFDYFCTNFWIRQVIELGVKKVKWPIIWNRESIRQVNIYRCGRSKLRPRWCRERNHMFRVSNIQISCSQKNEFLYMWSNTTKRKGHVNHAHHMKFSINFFLASLYMQICATCEYINLRLFWDWIMFTNLQKVAASGITFWGKLLFLSA
jgi:hypothetical protein